MQKDKQLIITLEGIALEGFPLRVTTCRCLHLVHGLLSIEQSVTAGCDNE